MSILPDTLERYRKFIGFMLKYRNSNLFLDTANNAMDVEGKEADTEQEYNQSPQDLIDDLQKMGPTYIKLGQLLSTRPDLLPDAYLKALATLQDDVEPISYEQVHQIIEEEIGVRISKAFESLDETPLASASIGQVHRAVLRSGKQVAVKVQRPGIRKKFLEDLDTLKELTELAMKHSSTARRYAFDDVLAELRHILLQELDYNREAQNLVTLGENLKSFINLQVPQPVFDYSSSKVLTMEYIDGKKITSISPLKFMEVDLEPLVDELVEAYLRQIVVDGFVHADPHPGNIHMTKDNKIALIDLGMVAKFTSNMQDKLLQLLIAISQEEGDKISDILLDISNISDEANIKLFRKTINTLVLDSQVTKAKDLQTGRLLIQMNRVAAENGTHIAVELNILGKILLNLDQIVAVLAPEYNLREAIQRHVQKMMQSKMYQELKPENLFSVLIETKKLTEKLPERLNKISESLANNNFRIKLDAINEKRFTDGFQKVANRITLGLIIAAMIIGAAMLMQVPTSFKIFGYPGLAIILFVVAAIAGIALSYNIIINDEDFNKKNKHTGHL